MFHGKQQDRRLERAATWAGIRLTTAQEQSLVEFGGWLATEGIEGGGIGPSEVPRIVDRHLADSLVFAGAWGETPRRVLDVGSGVGLPAIPLAITHPQSSFTLIDRSERRCRLARRAVRILGLQNVIVEQRDVGNETGVWAAVLFRASLPPGSAIVVAAPLLDDGGCAVVGLSRSAEPAVMPAAPPGTVLNFVRTDPGILDSPAWLLRMRRTDSRTKDGSPS